MGSEVLKTGGGVEAEKDERSKSLEYLSSVLLLAQAKPERLAGILYRTHPDVFDEKIRPHVSEETWGKRKELNYSLEFFERIVREVREKLTPQALYDIGTASFERYFAEIESNTDPGANEVAFRWNLGKSYETRASKRRFERSWEKFDQSSDEKEREYLAWTIMENMVLRRTRGYDPREENPSDPRVEKLGRIYARAQLKEVDMYDLRNERGIHPDDAAREIRSMLERKVFDVKTEPAVRSFLRERVIERIKVILKDLKGGSPKVIEEAKRRALLSVQEYEGYGVLSIEEDAGLFDLLTGS